MNITGQETSQDLEQTSLGADFNSYSTWTAKYNKIVYPRWLIASPTLMTYIDERLEVITIK